MSRPFFLASWPANQLQMPEKGGGVKEEGLWWLQSARKDSPSWRQFFSPPVFVCRPALCCCRRRSFCRRVFDPGLPGRAGLVPRCRREHSFSRGSSRGAARGGRAAAFVCSCVCACWPRSSSCPCFAAVCCRCRSEAAHLLGSYSTGGEHLPPCSTVGQWYFRARNSR
jgi:hypothetical protein